MNRTGRQVSIPSRAQLEAQAKRRRMLSFVSLGVLAAVVLIAVVLANRVPKAASDAPISAQVTVGQKAPAFAVSTTNGPFDLATAGGKPTLLEVFATWCPHCQREVSVLDPLYARYKSKVNFVAVSGSPYGMNGETANADPESQADVVAFAGKFHATYPIAFDPNLDVAHKYLQGGFPTVVLIGRDGTIQALRDGEIPPGDISDALDAAVAGKSPDPKMGAKG